MAAVVMMEKKLEGVNGGRRPYAIGRVVKVVCNDCGYTEYFEDMDQAIRAAEKHCNEHRSHSVGVIPQ